jgi:hypothetical protein
MTLADIVAGTRLDGLVYTSFNALLSYFFSVDAIQSKTVQNAGIELLIRGLQVRVLPGSPIPGGRG